MSQDPQRWISYRALTELAGTNASERDQDGLFPEHAFEGLRRLGLVSKPPLLSVEVERLLRVLAAIGRGNLSVGRIYEGHVNALLLIRWFGSPSQRKHLETSASEGALFGVWNTDLPDNPVRMDNGILQGAKSFERGGRFDLCCNYCRSTRRPPNADRAGKGPIHRPKLVEALGHARFRKSRCKLQ